MLEESVKKAYTNLKELGRKKIYIAVDIHDTIAEANYKNTMPDILKGAQKAIQALREFPEVVLILWSSCYESSYQTYLDHFKSHGMIFDYFNENPEVPNTETGDFTKKFYFNVLADDKAGFNESDWIRLVHAVAKYRVILEGGTPKFEYNFGYNLPLQIGIRREYGSDKIQLNENGELDYWLFNYRPRKGDITQPYLSELTDMKMEDYCLDAAIHLENLAKLFREFAEGKNELVYYPCKDIV